jgi:integrase
MQRQFLSIRTDLQRPEIDKYIHPFLRCCVTWASLDLRRPRGSGKQTTWLWPEQAFALFKEAEKINAEFATLLGRVFRFAKSGHLYSLLKAAAFKAGVDLPERSAFHIFRHTYATWMRREAGLDTKGLVATGAWRDRKSADRYEHMVVSEEARKAACCQRLKE